jgi:hypothetical protein
MVEAAKEEGIRNGKHQVLLVALSGGDCVRITLCLIEIWMALAWYGM